MLLERQPAAVVRETRLRYEIRPARSQDLPLLEWFGEYREMRLVETSAWAYVEAGTVLFLVADAGGFPVAQIKIALIHDEEAKADGLQSGYLYALRVFRPFQRLGIGSALIERAEELLRERGFRRVTIAAERQNVDARRLYERLGYTRVREQRRAWSYTDPDGQAHRTDFDEVLLAKDLE